MLNDKIILITGGTGSFGKQLTKSIIDRFSPKKLIIFSFSQADGVHTAHINREITKKWTD